MTTYTGYTETPEQIARRWERWQERAERIAAEKAAQLSNIKEQQPNLAVALQ